MSLPHKTQRREAFFSFPATESQAMTTGAVEKEHVEGLAEEEASTFDGDWEAKAERGGG